MSNKSKYKVGDFLVSFPLKEHIGIVIKVEKDFYKTTYGRMNRIIIHCETMDHKIFFLPEIQVGMPFHNEPGWVKPGKT
jgi:hypothetical protein|tara:strand:+ start:4844 stop:5080 length:237 start_codon:yes stop_codon:yes gene_type:complete